MDVFTTSKIYTFLDRVVRLAVPFLMSLTLVGCSFEASITKKEKSSAAPIELKIGDDISAIDVDEGSSLVFLVSLNHSQSVDTQLVVDISGDTSFISESLPITTTIAAGRTSATISLHTNHNANYSGNRNLSVTVTAAGTGVSSSFALTVKDIEAPPVISLSANSQNLSEGAGSGVATVNLSVASSQSVSVDYSFADGTAVNPSNYSGTAGALTFAPGETSKTIPFTVVDDAVTNATRSFAINLGAITGNATLGAVSSQAINILDNESPTLAIGNASGNQGSNVSFTVSLSPTSFQTVTVNYASSNSTAVAGTHYTTSSGTLTFNPGDSSKTITVPATSIAGEVCGPDRSFAISLSGASNAAIGVSSATGTISDTKVPSLSIADASATEGNNVVIVASLSQACASQNVSFNWATANGTALSGTDYTAVSTSASITAGSTSVNLPVATIDNGTYQGSRSFSVSLSGISNASSGTTSATGTVNDDELPMGTFAITGITSSGENILDDYLSNSTTPTVNWQSSTNATSYDVSIYESDGTTIKCAVQNTASTSLDLGGSCTLALGQTYKAKVVAKLASNTLAATNDLYSFYVNESPTLGTGGNGPWYIMAGSTLTINAVWAASPAIGVATDPESHSISFTSAGTGSLGTVTNNGSSLSFAANANAFGQDSIIYTITDAKGGTLTGTILVNVMTAYTWTGKLSSTWGTTGNWCGSISADSKSCAGAGAAPGATHVIVFDNTCASSFTCSPTTTANLSVAGVKISSNGFTQGNAFTLTVGSSGWAQSGGVFVGSNAAITQNGAVSLSGGSFTSTSNTMTLKSNYIVSGSPIFVHNSGTMQFSSTAPANIISGTSDYNHVRIGACNSSYNLNTSTWNILGSLTLEGSCGSGVLNSGTILASGNVALSGGGGYGTTLLKLVGSSAQTVTGASGARVPSFEIASSGTVNFVGTIEIFGDYIFTSGVVNVGTSTLYFRGNNNTIHTIVPGAITYNNVSFAGCQNHYELGGLTLEVGGVFLLDAPCSSGSVNNGVVAVSGNFTSAGSGFGGSAIIRIVGSGVQSVSGVLSASIPSLEINSSGNVNLSGVINVNRNYTYISGSVNAGTSTLYMSGSGTGNSHSFTPGPVAYNIVQFGGCNEHFDLGGGVLSVYGTLNLQASCSYRYLNNGTVNIYGDISVISANTHGSALLKVIGSGSQLITGTTGITLSNLEIAATGTVSLNGNIALRGNYSYVSGVLNAGTSTMEFNGNPGDSFTITPGSVNYANVQFFGCSATFDLAGGTFNVNGSLLLASACGSSSINNGVLQVAGDVIATVSRSGNVQLQFVGGLDSALTVATGVSLPSGNVTVNKSSGAKLTLGGTTSTISFNSTGQQFNVTSGSVDMAGKSLTVKGLSLNGNTLTKSAGVLTVNGTVAGTGALYGGTVNP